MSWPDSFCIVKQPAQPDNESGCGTGRCLLRNALLQLLVIVGIAYDDAVELA